MADALPQVSVVNAGVVYCEISGFGEGAGRDLPDYDPLVDEHLRRANRPLPREPVAHAGGAQRRPPDRDEHGDELRKWLSA